MPIPHTRPPVLAAFLLTLTLAAAALAAPLPVLAQSLPTIEDHTEGTTQMEGFFNLYWDDATGSLYWEIADLDSEFLYQISMGSGLGSNPVGIDRGQLRGTHVFEARRIGPRVLLVEPNYGFRAISDNASEVQAVRGRLRAVGALGLRHRGPHRRARAGGRHRVLHARRARGGEPDRAT